MRSSKSVNKKAKVKGKAALPLYEVLKSIDPEVSPEYQFPWLFLPKSEERMPVENEILKSLQSHCLATRGDYSNAKSKANPDNIYADDSRIKGLTRKLEFDFYLPSFNVVIEFDELQHFTAERKVTLEHYPSENFSFDVNRWEKLCEMKKKDADPPERDWQRAFRDAVRDLRAREHGVPLIRLFVKDFDGEKLKDPKVRQELDLLIRDASRETSLAREHGFDLD